MGCRPMSLVSTDFSASFMSSSGSGFLRFSAFHPRLTEGLALVLLHQAEDDETEDEEGHEGHGSPGYYSQHRHLHTGLQEL